MDVNGYFVNQKTYISFLAGQPCSSPSVGGWLGTIQPLQGLPDNLPRGPGFVFLAREFLKVGTPDKKNSIKSVYPLIN